MNRFTTEKEIERFFSNTSNPACGVGPIIHQKGRRSYIDDSQHHVVVTGNTGQGKTQCFSMQTVKRAAEKGESVIIADSKGVIYHTVGRYLEGFGQTACIDFSEPFNSPDGWDPMKLIKELLQSEDPGLKELGVLLAWTFALCLCRPSGPDPFWMEASREIIEGLINALIETADEDEINLESVGRMFQQAEKKLGNTTLLKAFYDYLPEDSIAKGSLATYVTGPSETRASIHSVASSRIQEFRRSRGIIELLKNDTLDLMNLDVTKPFVIFIILPDNTDAYNAMAGALVSQIAQVLYLKARAFKGNRLPIRVHFLLEELGSVGRGIPNLPELITQGRSRNIRLYLVLQSMSQLDDVYGHEKADIIRSCIGTTIAFSSNDFKLMEDLSKRCGSRWVSKGDQLVNEPVIRADELAAMPLGRALVMVDNQYKFISQLPFFYEMYPEAEWTDPKFEHRRGKPMRILDFEDMVLEMREKKIDALLSGEPVKPKKQDPPKPPTSYRPLLESKTIDFDSINAKINAEIERLQKEGKLPETAQSAKKYHVQITDDRGKTWDIAWIIAAATGDNIMSATDSLRKFPVDMEFDTKKEAEKFVKAITDAGGVATLVSQ